MGASTTMRVRVSLSFYVLCVYVYVRVHACPLARGRAPSRTLRRAIVHQLKPFERKRNAIPGTYQMFGQLCQVEMIFSIVTNAAGRLDAHAWRAGRGAVPMVCPRS